MIGNREFLYYCPDGEQYLDLLDHAREKAQEYQHVISRCERNGQSSSCSKGIYWDIGCADNGRGRKERRVRAANALAVLFHELGHAKYQHQQNQQQQCQLSEIEYRCLPLAMKLEREKNAWAQGMELVEAFI